MHRFRVEILICIMMLLAIPLESIAKVELIRTSDFSDAISICKKVLAEFLNSSKAPGLSIAVSYGGDLIWSEGFGRTDLELDVPVTVDTKLGLGSVTKPLTMALCARLVDKGMLNLDKPIESYLPEFPKAGKGITVRLLGGHLSGYDDSFAAARFYSNEHFKGTQDVLESIWNQDLLCEPGSEHHYANGTYTIIAAVIEKVTGLTFTQAMSKYVLDPLSMNSTCPNDPTQIVCRRTSFYQQSEDGNISEVATFDPSHKLAAAGYLSTPNDLITFGNALLDEGFLSTTSRSKLFTPLATTDGEETIFGLGWRIAEEDGRTVYYQPGGGPGISTLLVMLPKERLVIAIQSNITAAPVLELYEPIAGSFLSAISAVED